MNINGIESKLAGVSSSIDSIENTYSQKAGPHGCFESSDLGTPSANAFSKIDHHRPKVLDLFQSFCDFLQDGEIVWSRENTYEVMSLSNRMQINTWTEENLLELRSSLGCIRKPMKETVDRETLLP